MRHYSCCKSLKMLFIKEKRVFLAYPDLKSTRFNFHCDELNATASFCVMMNFPKTVVISVVIAESYSCNPSPSVTGLKGCSLYREFFLGKQWQQLDFRRLNISSYCKRTMIKNGRGLREQMRKARSVEKLLERDKEIHRVKSVKKKGHSCR